MDPQITSTAYDLNILGNVYQSLLYINQSSSGSAVIVPWLAQNYTVSADGSTANFTLKSGIAFADGEQMNSSAVYFAVNRFLIEDGSSPFGHGTQLSYILQQLFNTSLSSALSGTPQPYNQNWVNEVLAENAVQITGPLTFTLHIQNPNPALPYLLEFTTMVLAPAYVMEHDVGIWNQSGTGYTLPYPKLSGNLTSMMYQYFVDEVSTCNAGTTPKGCGTTYLDGSNQGSLAGTGPYDIKSADATTGDVVLVANPHYWGWTPTPVPTGESNPPIKTIDINYVPNLRTRELDLQNAGNSGQAMTIDVTGDHLYDVADRSAWLANGTLQSILNGVTLYGPYTTHATLFEPFCTNVTNPQTGNYYTFQPFADRRLRLAFADSVNMSEINTLSNNNLGKVANEAIPPGEPPEGSYNSSITPGYSFNTSAVQNLLLDAMMHPLTNFNFFNGSAAPSGLFNNTFGCPALGSNGQCSHPVAQTIALPYYVGAPVDPAVFQQMASVINNVSQTYNMGLTVNVEPLPLASLFSQGLADQLYLYSSGWYGAYPWVTDFLSIVFNPFLAANGFNLTAVNSLLAQTQVATSTNNVTGLIKITNDINELANQAVMYVWTINPDIFSVYTSNVHGYVNNPYYTPTYFATLY